MRALILAALLLSGCGSSLAAAPTPPVLHRAALPGDGSASIRAAFRLPGRRLLNTSGAPATTLAALSEVKLYLVQAPTGEPPTGLLTPVAGSGFTYALDGGNRDAARVDVVYTHVAANAPGQSYFLAVNASGADGDVTNAAAPARVGALRCYVSDAGGAVEAPGSVRVEPQTYALDATAPLTATLKLRDARPATLRANVTITDGG